jgi:hypothetical protein
MSSHPGQRGRKLERRFAGAPFEIPIALYLGLPRWHRHRRRRLRQRHHTRTLDTALPVWLVQAEPSGPHRGALHRRRQTPPAGPRRSGRPHPPRLRRDPVRRGAGLRRHLPRHRHRVLRDGRDRRRLLRPAPRPQRLPPGTVHCHRQAHASGALLIHRVVQSNQVLDRSGGRRRLLRCVGCARSG